MGWIEFQFGHYADAIRWLKMAAHTETRNAEVLEHLGDAYSKQGSPGKATKYYRRALKLTPSNEKLRRKI
jgi:Flp pilus assembly protein TadD